MKNRSILIWIVLCAVAASSVLAESVDEILDNYREARGGVEKIKSVDSARLSGTMVMGGQVQAPFVWTWKRPNKMRMEFTIQGQTVIQAFDGKSGWAVAPMMGMTTPQPMSEEESLAFSEQADFDGQFIDSEQKGYSFEYVAQEEVDGKQAHKVKVTSKDGEVSHVYFDAESHLEIKTEGKRNIRGQEVEFEASQGDFKEVDGLVFAHYLESKPKGAPVGQTVNFEKIELNVEIDDSTFAMPAVEAPAAPEGVQVEPDGSE